MRPERRSIPWIIALALQVPVTAEIARADVQHACYRLEDPDKQIGACSELIESPGLDRDDRVRALVARGNAYAIERDYDRAVADFTKAIELDRTDSAAYTGRGFAYRKKGEYAAAIDDYTRAMELSPDDTTSAFRRAIVYDKTGEYEKAIADYTRVIAQRPGWAKAYAKRALVHEIVGDTEKAAADFRKVLELSPNDEVAQDGLERLGEKQ